MLDETQFEYVGFWARVGAALIDTVLVSMITIPLLLTLYGREYWTHDRLFAGPIDFLVSWVFPALAVIAFWLARGATPGKMAVSAQVVDARTGALPTVGQSIARYAGYYVAAIPLGLGLAWVGLDARKQGWHDKIAATVVVRRKRGSTQPAGHGPGEKDSAR